MKNSRSPTFSIILVESALECIRFRPKNKKNLKKIQIQKNKSLENIILDVSIHNHLMQNLPEKNKRGRPDIIHNSLLLALGSRLNKEGRLNFFVHTRNDEIITFNPALRIPRNYNRFIGLMQQLFKVKRIPPHAPQTLISITSESLEELLHILNPDRIILYSERGTRYNDEDLKKIFSENNNVVALIGGFPHGDFSQKVLNFPALNVSIFPDSLDTLQVVSYTIHIAEQAFKFDRT
jgi:rRNA small subunit pseudouridine methyltransferase Nep1